MSRLVVLLFVAMVLFSGALAPVLCAEQQKFGGVGLQVVPTITGELVVLNALEGAPAADKGVLPGDLIFQVDDFPLQGSEFGKVVSEHLWGPAGSEVEIFYRRPGMAGVSRVVLKRTAIEPQLTVTPTAQHGSTNSSGGN